ncbi:hypothetical protein DPEC_G00105540 [Dallia pectoralis]|uniref:Uncharacterized protein n=1 Tax=Dallia pectoralis TaxID=75939 RepID=A0ACC2GXU5_DALPE|nr:hypothetical protein DPEC_G00105540 [Dallia pectoralis]
MTSEGLIMRAFTVSLYLIAVCSLGDTSWLSTTCRGEWQRFGSHYFFFDQTQRSWTDSERNCESLDGHLASVHSTEESRFLEELAGGSTITWIGGNDGGRPEMTQPRTWTWTDSTMFNYHEWADGEPNNFNGVRESCIQMNFGDEHRWNDEVCEKDFASICSRHIRTTVKIAC